MFLVDNERWKRLWIRIADLRVRLPSSTAGGHFHTQLRVPRAVAEEGGLVHAQLINLPGDDRERKAEIHLVPDDGEGFSVISDIDDTIKVTEVLDKRAVVENTLFKAFRPVEGMAEIYRRWARAGGSLPLRLELPVAALPQPAPPPRPLRVPRRKLAPEPPSHQGPGASPTSSNRPSARSRRPSRAS